MKSIRVLAFTAAAVASFSLPALAAPINVLWYTGGVGDSGGPSDYQGDVQMLSAPMGGDPAAGASASWNITFWNSGAMPTGSFNVLVVASPQGGWNPPPIYSALESAGLSASSFGSRVMLTGQDADWHYTNSPGPTNFDGPRGFLRDSISWAGSGTGLGLVMLGQDGIGGDSGVNFGFTGFSDGGDATNNVVIPGIESGFAINGGLDSAGISNWDTAAHDTFTGLNTALWNGINLDGDVAGQFVTIVSAGAAAGGTSGGGTVPEPFTLSVFGAGLAGAAFLRRRRKKALSA
jgi:hypothetical protein